MYSFQHPRPDIALIHNHGSSPEIQVKNTSMITVVFQMAVDPEKSKNRLNVQMQRWNTIFFFSVSAVLQVHYHPSSKPSFGK